MRQKTNRPRDGWALAAEPAGQARTAAAGSGSCVGLAGGVEHRPEPHGRQRQGQAAGRAVLQLQSPNAAASGALRGASPIPLPPRSAGWAPPKTLCPAGREFPDVCRLPAHLNPALKAALTAQGFTDMPHFSIPPALGVWFAMAECSVNH